MIVAIGSASFGKADDRPLRLLVDAGVEVRQNPHGRALDEGEAAALVADVDGWIAGSEPVSRRVMSRAPRLRAVARIGVGLDNVDLGAARELGIAVSSTPDAPTDAVAEMTLAAMLALTRRLVPMSAAMRSGHWTRCLGGSLGGATVLVIGFGRIGRRTAELLRPFGARVLACDPLAEVVPEGVRRVGLAEGLAQADVISLHAGGRDRILDAAAFAAMKDGVLLLNSARGALVDHDALAEALRAGRIGGCWLDVYDEEPYSGPLLAFEQVLATPHAATFTHECRLRMEVEAASNLLRDLRAGACER